jgi:membrane-bound lytic murein transglycosylase A
MKVKPIIALWILISFIGIFIGTLVLYRLLWPPTLPPVKPVTPLIEQLSIEHLPSFEDHGDKKSLHKSIAASLEYLETRRDEEQIPLGNGWVTIGILKKSLKSFSLLLDQELKQQDFQKKIQDMFRVYRVTGGESKKDPFGPLLVTGYFQPELTASLEANEEFSYPLYGIPRDLIRIALNDFDSSLPNKTLWGKVSGQSLIPYYTRSDIDNDNKLENADVLAWLRSPVDGLILHIQGSGLLRFQDESGRYIHYACSNGYPYHSIFRWLIDQKLITRDQANWEYIRTWAHENPEEFSTAFTANPRYIFFKWEQKGPIGTLGEVLIPMRSVALDHNIYPSGALCFLQTTMPENKSVQKDSEIFQGFMCNQDTGSAIKGPYRLDLYCGEGDKAGYIAERLKTPGSLYILLTKDAFQGI